MNSNLFKTVSILLYTVSVMGAGSTVQPSGTSVTNAGKDNEVTATVNPEATKEPENYDLTPMENNTPSDKSPQSLEDVTKEAEKDNLVPISTFALYASPKEILGAPTPVLVSAQKLLEESVAPGNPQIVQIGGGSGKKDEEKDSAESDKEKDTSTTDKDKSKDEETPSTSEGDKLK
ncbi:hypothetical protein NGRA_0629 [Nosema granulosis]|uniref:Uncharacterized protein n=1 Tax=Nosema granulosis TaxID=83296 RepID=A0A9P6H114_9MICR|nr:hypothetical protein NGRA_0629 [Nosema granulosis]